MLGSHFFVKHVVGCHVSFFLVQGFVCLFPANIKHLSIYLSSVILAKHRTINGWVSHNCLLV